MLTMNKHNKLNKKAYLGLFRIAIVVLIILLIILGVIIYSIWFAKSQGLNQQEQENLKIKKAYSWLQSKTIGKWAVLTTEQHVFSFLALRNNLAQSDIDSAVNSLLFKSDNRKCWPKQNCNIKETAIAKIMLDSSIVNADTGNISKWLMERNISISGIDWHLQITPRNLGKINCTINYDNTNYQIFVDEKNRISGNAGSCFSMDNYWFKLNANCGDKKFNISCNDSTTVNFLLKKNQDFYVIKNNIDLFYNEIKEIGVDSYCLKNSAGVCDYEGTLWATYAFSLRNEQENLKLLLPYLLIFSSNENQKYFPESFLYSITKRESFYQDIENKKGNYNFITLTQTAYNQYYDSALAMVMTEDYSSRGALLTMKSKILEVQNTRGYWEISPGDMQRDTALIILGFFKEYQERSECELRGYSCVANCSLYGGVLASYYCETGECCQANLRCEDRNGICKTSCLSNETQVSYSCGSGVCCKPLSLSSCLSEIGGNICLSNQGCFDSNNNSIDFISSVDSRCCRGNCYALQLRTCSELYGNICSPESGLSCPNNDWFTQSQSSDSFCCRQQCDQGLGTCSNYGGEICNESYACKGAVPSIASDTNGLETCCAGGRCVPKTCDGLGIPCLGGERCSGNSIETFDQLICCLDGQCLVSCSNLGGNPCPDDKSCDGELKESYDYSRCCIGECKEKAKFPWFILWIILGIGIIGLLFFFRKKIFKKKDDNNKNQTQQSNIFSRPTLKPQIQRTQPIQRPTLQQKPVSNLQRPSLQKTNQLKLPLPPKPK